MAQGAAGAAAPRPGAFPGRIRLLRTPPAGVAEAVTTRPWQTQYAASALRKEEAAHGVPPPVREGWFTPREARREQRGRRGRGRACEGVVTVNCGDWGSLSLEMGHLSQMKAVKSVDGLSKHQHDRKMSQEHEFRCILLEVWELPETALCGESQKEKKATKIAQLPCNLPHRGCDTVEQFRIQGLEMLKRLAEHESLESYMQDTASL